MHETAKLPSTSTGENYSERRSSRAEQRFLRIEFWLPIAVIFVFCLVVSAELGYAASGGGEVYNPSISSNSIRQITFLALGFTGFYMLTLARPATLKPQIAWTVLIPILCLTAYVFVSILWSDDSTMTLKRAMTVLMVVVAGLGIGRVWNLHDYAWGITIISGLLLVLGVLIELQYCSFLHVSEYRFSGLFHPAKQSFNCGFLLLASLAIYFYQGRPWVLIIAAVALVFMILTKARTGTAAALLASVWLSCHFTSIRGWLLVGIAGLGLGAAGLLFYQGATGSELDTTAITTMGRDKEAADPTKLTGRLPIWAHAFDQYSEQPVLGYGYGAYWTLERLAEFERLNGWALYHSHSSYIETLLNLGLVGFILGITTIAIVFHRELTLRRQGAALSILVSSVLLLALIGGFFEIAFIGLGYASLVPMIGMGVLIFSASPERKAGP